MIGKGEEERLLELFELIENDILAGLGFLGKEERLGFVIFGL